jgi:hypothetical protein
MSCLLLTPLIHISARLAESKQGIPEREQGKILRVVVMLTGMHNRGKSASPETLLLLLQQLVYKCMTIAYAAAVAATNRQPR